MADWSNEVVLLTVGRIEPEKNPLLLIEALSTLQRRGTGDYRLIWAGEGRLAETVRDAAATAGIGDRVELRGHVPFGPPLIELYRGAHAFVHVALTEGEPQVIHEAMGCGLPIVATDVGGVRNAPPGRRRRALGPPERQSRTGRRCRAATRRPCVAREPRLSRPSTRRRSDD